MVSKNTTAAVAAFVTAQWVGMAMPSGERAAADNRPLD